MKLALSTLVAVAVAAASAQTNAYASTADPWLHAFKAICWDPFGDKSRVEAAVSSYGQIEFQRLESKPGALQFGMTWESPKSSYTYTDSELLPRSLPSPQCQFVADTGADFDHSAAAAALGAMLPIGEGKTKGKGLRQRTEWNFPGPDGSKRRLFLSSQPGGTGIQTHISLLNIR
ncbi:MAG TPA: hypothetical protein VGR19_09345 [Allosphingosinicella sp.]|nr:hypothetical protein [Allosphingosinicella sp.]